MAEYIADFEFNSNTIEFDSSISKNKLQADLIVNLMPSKVSQLENDLHFQTDTDVQETIAPLVLDITNIENTLSTFGNIVTHNVDEFATAAQGALADTALQPNDNISELTNDAGYITKDVDNLENYMLSVDIEAASAALSNRITEEENTRASEVTRLEELISEAGGDVTAEREARIAADEVLQTNINSEASTRAEADTALGTRIGAEETTRASEIERVEGLISDETSARTEADTTLQTAINAEVTNREAADTALGTRITNEATARTAADTTLQNNINSEASTRASEIERVEDLIEEASEDIVTEREARIAADTALGTRITNETTARETADTTLNTKIANEETTRVSEIERVEDLISDEASARETADTTLNTKITNETSAREIADTALGTRITNEITAREEADAAIQDTLDTFGNIVTHNVDEFATAAQGTLADTAIQPNDNISELTNDAGYITTAAVGKGTLTIQKNGTTVDTFNANASSNKTINLLVPTNNNELENGAGYITTEALEPYAKTEDLPEVNNGTLTIQVNGTSIATFTANQSGPTTANVEVPDSATWGNISGTLSNQTDLQTALNGKQSTISDLSTIRSGAALGATSIQPNDDISELNNDAGYITSAAVGTGILTIQRNGTTVDTFSANATNNKIINLSVPTTASEVGALPDTTTLSDLANTTEKAVLSSGITSGLVRQIGTNQTNISNIEAKIPNDASASNQLADKRFVNSSIATNTAYFIGTFNSVAELEAYSGTVTLNDYAFVATTDSAGNTLYDRYKWNGSEWLFEYELNNSSFTADQWASINSLATASKIAQIATNTTNISSLQTNKADKSELPTKVSELTNDSGYITGIASSDVITALGYTPYNSSNPNGYTSNVGTVTSVNNISPVNGNVTLSIPSAVTESTVSGWGFTKNLGTVTSVNNVEPVDGNVTLTMPTVGEGTITIMQGSTNKGSFTVNQSGNTTIYLESTASDPIVVDGELSTTSTNPVQNKVITTALNGKQATIIDLSTIRSGANLGATSIQPNDNISELTNDVGYLTGITSAEVISALGYTPYNSTNPAGYTNNVGTVTSVNGINPVNGNVTLSIPSVTNLANKDLSNLSATGEAKFQAPLVSGTNIKTVNNTSLLGNGNVAVQPTLVSGTNIKTINSTSLLGSGNIATGTVTSVNNVSPVNGNVTLSIPSTDNLADKDLSNLSSTGNAKFQAPLVSGTNIKTINSTSILGSGNISVATSAQGALADTALQPNDDISELNNDAGYITGITSSDVITALGFIPYDSANPVGYISGITSSDVTMALGYTPYDSTNPNNYTSVVESTVSGWGFTKNTGTVTSVNNVSPINGNVTLSIPSVEAYTAAEVETLWGSIA